MRCPLWRGAVLTGLMAAALLVVPGRFASAAPVLTFNEASGDDGVNQGQNVGWQFNVLSPIGVTGLGWFDEGANGLGHEHLVAIWAPDGSLLTSALVPAGVVAPLDGQFRTVPITPLLLPVGNGYIVGGLNYSDSGDRLANDVTQTVDPRISFVDATFSNFTAVLTRPTMFSSAETGFYGPSFSVGEVPGQLPVVPEPATMALLATGALPLLLRRRRQGQPKADIA